MCQENEETVAPHSNISFFFTSLTTSASLQLFFRTSLFLLSTLADDQKRDSIRELRRIKKSQYSNLRAMRRILREKDWSIRANSVYFVVEKEWALKWYRRLLSIVDVV